ncbi:MAG TPA: nitroreductase family protein [Chloroflexota bacterium]|jgi:nitroreductase
MSVSSEELLTFLRRLRAVKAYTAEPVSQEKIEAILEVGRWTGTGANRQPTEVVVIRDAETKRKFGEWGAQPAATAAVVLLLVTTAEAAMFDEGRVAERLALAAAAFGLGSTAATLKNDGPELAKQLLGIPAERRAVAMIAIGHPDIEARRARPKVAQARKPLAEFAHWDRF